MEEGRLTWPRAAARRWPGNGSDKLDRALVAGLMLEAVLAEMVPPGDPEVRRRLIKTRLRDSLVFHLAGRVTLDRFRGLIHRLDHWFPLYYPLIAPDPAPERPFGTPAAAGGGPPADSVLRTALLRDWLEKQTQEILPRRPHRKLHRHKLWQFLVQTRGGWFRVTDFERCFQVDRKTAWEYLQKLRQAGLLRHNGARSAAVRYGLAGGFLKVAAESLQQAVESALKSQSRTAAEQVVDRLIASGGGAFWEDAWPGGSGGVPATEIISLLLAAGILAVVRQVGGRRLLQPAPTFQNSDSARLPREGEKNYPPLTTSAGPNPP